MRGYIVSKKKSLEEFLRNNRHFMLPVILLGGFIVDTLTLGQVDRIFDNVVLIVHLVIVATTIALIFSAESRFGRRFKIRERESTITALMLFSFGGLFSGFTVFYAKSGSLISSWPFILFMIAVMLGTEVRKRYFQAMLLQISIFYIALFSYLIFSVPVLVRQMGPLIYMLSGATSLVLMVLYILLLKRLNRGAVVANRGKIASRIVAIFAIFNILYFLNVIPPMPLSLQYRFVYHDFYRIQAIEYRGGYEPAPNWQFWQKRSRTFHRFGTEPVYVFSEVYAPVRLNTDIYHVWQYFDPAKTRWVTTDRIKIPITGGRADGFRGFSKKTNVWPGAWRVKIETARGQTVGQFRFSIKNASVAPETVQESFR